jgi:hypothetical protein
VDSGHLKPWQPKLRCAALRPTLGYLYRLRDHMEKRRFPPAEKLLRLTATASEALHTLCVELHYMSCEGGVGRKPQSGTWLGVGSGAQVWLRGSLR